EYQGEGVPVTGDKPLVVAGEVTPDSEGGDLNISVYSGGIPTTNKLFYAPVSTLFSSDGKSGIALIGSSSTQLPANDGWTDADRWSNMLADTLNTTVYNYGKSGASAQYFADNTNNVMTNLIADNPKYCIIMLGLNKTPGGTAGERTAGQTIINTLKGAGIIPVIMSTGMSVDYANGHYSFNRDFDIIERDTVWRNLADENELGYIDIWQRSLDEIADGRTRTIAGVTYDAWDWRIRNVNACPNDDIFAPHAGHDIQAGVKTNVQDNYPNHIDLGSTWFTNIHLNRHGSFVVQNEIGQYFRTLVNFDSVTLTPTSGSVFETQTYEIT